MLGEGGEELGMQQKQLRTEVNIRPWELLNALTSREYLVAFSSYDILKKMAKFMFVKILKYYLFLT